jgi:uracil-DNA glycosylase family 4
MSEDALWRIASEVKVCEKCPLHLGRKNAVPGEGDVGASVVVIGEGPGANEDEQGRPFVGSAGKNLDALLSLGGVARKEVFITNTVKCRPPDNRRPRNEELDACYPYLRRQLEAIRPSVVVLLGDTALKEFFPDRSLGEAHGRVLKRNDVSFFPTYHPASMIYNRSLSKTLEEDFRRLKDLLTGTSGGL